MKRASVNQRILEFRVEFTQAVERFGVVSNIHIGIGQDRLDRRLDSLDQHVQAIQDRMPQRQQTLPNATFQVQNKIPCDPGTRKLVLEEIMKWISDIREDSSCFFWLSGDPGVGKSAVTASIAQECKRRKILWAQFFINRNDASTTDPQLYFPTIVKQMSERKPVVSCAVEDILKEQPDLMKDNIFTQATELFLKVVHVASKSTPGQPIVIVIDALDETDLKRLKTTAEVFSRILVDLPSNVKVFISSRVENVIRDNFGRHPRARNIHLSARTSVADVTQFLETKVHEIMAEYHIDWSHWGHQRMRKLCSQASGLFIWAVTAIAYLRVQIEDFGRECLDGVLDELNANGMDDMNVLYMAILKRTYRRETSPWQIQCFRRIIGAILAQQSPLPIEDLQGLLDLRNPNTGVLVDVEHFVRRLRTVLVPGVGEINGRTIPRVHKSFVDFITSTDAQEFLIDMAASHGELALQCIDRLVQLWKGKDLPRQLHYAVSHWSSHLTHVIMAPLASEEAEDDATSVDDGENSILSRQDLKDESGISVDPRPMANVDNMTKWLISISPNKSHIAYAGGSSFHLREFETGNTPVTFNGHAGVVSSATFSPDGSCVVTASDDKTLRIWDVETGNVIGGPFEGHTGYVVTATFSSDGKQIVSGSIDKTVRVWDAQTGQELLLFEGHTEAVAFAVFSPDSKYILSSSYDMTIRLWDTQTGKVIYVLPMEGNTKKVPAAFFSPDGKSVLSSSGDRTIIIWDVTTGEQIPEFFTSSGFNRSTPTLTFTPGSASYIETPTTAVIKNQNPLQSYIFPVGIGGTVGGISNAWIYSHEDFIASVYLGQLIMTMWIPT
ncbi:hypothetical protein GALMADRAFT_220170 [Galerina marginata CBS 339.88]|uniref:Nephrocystin 3-like N-terminal domain-containing protein n=1 Tax=Galerina marginata (strain CBS 339.88) TaxID=685588 RepID=A0A067TQ22_GALM3|nr:hypothetical protein GALMADRAFT_220170 [Galerina marginata CBS 339.88]